MKDIHILEQSSKRKFIQINGRRNNTKRKNRDQPENFQHITGKIDDILKKDYDSWNHQQENFDIVQSQMAHNTKLIGKYIKCIYSQYKIPDPLDPKSHFSRLEPTKSTRKILDLFHIKQNKKTIYKTPQKQENKDNYNFSNINFAINSAQSTKPQFKLHNSRANTSYTARQTAFLNQSTDKHSHNQNQNKNHALGHQFSHSSRILDSQATNFYFVHRQFVKQSYRYCVGCQMAILQNNIQVHEKGCAKYRQILNRNPQQILQIIQSKILEIAQRMQRNKKALQYKDAEQMGVISERLISSSRKCISLGKKSKIDEKFKKQYNRGMIIGKKWCQHIQQTSKLNWFMRMKQQLSKQVFKK